MEHDDILFRDFVYNTQRCQHLLGLPVMTRQALHYKWHRFKPEWKTDIVQGIKDKRVSLDIETGRNRKTESKKKDTFVSGRDKVWPDLTKYNDYSRR